MTKLEHINSRGLINGWHAQQLQRKSIESVETMASSFNRSIQNSLAFSVPAKAIKITSRFITYQFLDGSISKFINQNHKD
jgi:hypothetical protein